MCVLSAAYPLMLIIFDLSAVMHQLFISFGLVSAPTMSPTVISHLREPTECLLCASSVVLLLRVTVGLHYLSLLSYLNGSPRYRGDCSHYIRTNAVFTLIAAIPLTFAFLPTFFLF